MVTPEHRARPPRHSRRRRRDERRGRRHRRDHREAAAGSSSASASRSRRRRHREREEAVRESRRERSGRPDDDSAKVPAPASPPTKRPRLRSEVGKVRGCLWRFEPFISPVVEDEAVSVPAVEDGVAVAPTSSSSSPLAPAVGNSDGAVVFAREAAPPKGRRGTGTGTAPSSSPAAPPSAATTGVLFACQLSVSVSVPAPPPPLSFQAVAPQALDFPAAAPHPMPPASTPCPKRTAAAVHCTSRLVPYAIPAIPPPEQQHDADELRRAKVLQRYAGLIAKTRQETDERYRNLLRSGKAPPPPPPPPPPPQPPAAAAAKETLRRVAARDAARERFREALREVESKARAAALFEQMARPELLRAIGIDKAMERVVSPERPRDANGAPIVSPEHPCSPLEKLGYFLKAQ